MRVEASEALLPTCSLGCSVIRRYGSVEGCTKASPCRLSSSRGGVAEQSGPRGERAGGIVSSLDESAEAKRSLLCYGYQVSCYDNTLAVCYSLQLLPKTCQKTCPKTLQMVHMLQGLQQPV